MNKSWLHLKYFSAFLCFWFLIGCNQTPAVKYKRPISHAPFKQEKFIFIEIVDRETFSLGHLFNIYISNSSSEFTKEDYREMGAWSSFKFTVSKEDLEKMTGDIQGFRTKMKEPEKGSEALVVALGDGREKQVVFVGDNGVKSFLEVLQTDSAKKYEDLNKELGRMKRRTEGKY